MAFLGAFLYVLTVKLFSGVRFSSDFTLAIAQNTVNFLYIFHAVNIGLALFNLIPVPPLDGSRLLCALLPTKTYFAIMKYERTIYFVLIGWLLIGGYASGILLSMDFVASNPVLSTVARIFSLSDLLSGAIDALSALMIDLFSSIPFLRI